MTRSELTRFWSDICIVALESIMAESGDTNSVQYNSVRNATENIMKSMISSGMSKDSMLSYVQNFLQMKKKFNELRSESSDNNFFKATPVELIPAAIVAMCVESSIEGGVSMEDFGEIVIEANSHMKNYAHQ